MEVPGDSSHASAVADHADADAEIGHPGRTGEEPTTSMPLCEFPTAQETPTS